MRKEKITELNNYINELKTIKKEIIDVPYNDKFIKSTTFKMTLNNGKIIHREKISKGGNDGSAVIIFPMLKGTNEILVNIEPRVFTKDTVSLGFPAGYIEKDENPIDAALRELREETGYTSDTVEIIDSFYQDEGISSAYNHIVLATNAYKASNQDLDPEELIYYMTFTIEELLELEQMEYLNSSNTKLTLHKSIKRLGDKNEL